jgi:hypothetical protein
MIQTERPEWVDHTPEYEYKLVAFDDSGNSVQEIRMTRDKYDALKVELARLLGIATEGRH